METLDYNKQANDFLQSTGATFKAEFKKHDFHFQGDKDTRDIYAITLERNGRKYTFDFGQSIMHSGKYIFKRYKQNPICFQEMPKHGMLAEKAIGYSVSLSEIFKNPDFEVPNAYSVLVCLQKYDVGSFDDFCSEFGYEFSNSKEYKACEKTYKAVVSEYDNLQKLFSESEMELLRDIQ